MLVIQFGNFSSHCDSAIDRRALQITWITVKESPFAGTLNQFDDWPSIWFVNDVARALAPVPVTAHQVCLRASFAFPVLLGLPAPKLAFKL
jgi:hypothetical protein